MIQRRLTAFGVILFIVLTAFQLSTGKSGGKPRIKEAFNYRSGHTSVYYYSPSGYILRIQSSKGSNSTYDYVGNKIIKRVNDSSAHKYTVDTIILNKDGMMDQLSADRRYSTPAPLEYDADKHLVKSKMLDEKGRLMGMAVCEYVNGNQVENTFYDENNKRFNTTLYTYYTDKENTIGYENMGMPFMGSNSKNPIRESKNFNASNPGDTLRNTYNYHFDEKGRISIKATYDRSGRIADSIHYSYY